VVFVDLQVPDELKEETYLEALLSCWLCAFVFPIKDLHNIQHGTFKVASLMASGHVFGLVTSVLESIYQGVTMISKSPVSRKTDDRFAIHYLYAWISHFFKTHRVVNSKLAKPLIVKYFGVSCAAVFDELSTRERVRLGKKFFWHGTAFKMEYDHTFINNEDLSISKLFYFIILHSRYLSFRCEDYHIVQSYSPHRFSRHFGFYQDIPGDLKEQINTCSLEEMYQLYQSLTRCKTSSKVFVPVYSTNFGSRVTHGHEKWWQKVYGDDFTKGTELLAKIAFSPLSHL
jgi:hypothetical protein